MADLERRTVLSAKRSLFCACHDEDSNVGKLISVNVLEKLFQLGEIFAKTFSHCDGVANLEVTRRIIQKCPLGICSTIFSDPGE